MLVYTTFAGNRQSGKHPATGYAWMLHGIPPARDGHGNIFPFHHPSIQTPQDDTMIRQELLDIIACPKCKGPVQLNEEEDGLVCLHCRLLYAIRDEIPIMLIDEATPLEGPEVDKNNDT